MAWNFNDTVPIYLQAATRIRSDIVCGRYEKREKLPSVRDMALEAAINPNTMQKAFSLLESEGLVITEGTAGRFVTDEDEAIRRARESMAAAITQRFANEITKLGYSSKEAAALVLSYCPAETTNDLEVHCNGSADS